MNVGDQTFTFGKHSGKTFSWVAENEKGYCSWASGKGGLLKPFNDFIRNQNLDAVAPLLGDDEDLNNAARALLRRSGHAVAAGEADRKNRKREKQHRENVADARFQISNKFRSHGYESAAEMEANEPELRELIHSGRSSAKNASGASFNDEDEEEEKEEENSVLMQAAKFIIEVHRSSDLTERRKLNKLDNVTRKQIHTMAEPYGDLEVYTTGRADPKNKKKRHRGPTVASMIIKKKGGPK